MTDTSGDLERSEYIFVVRTDVVDYKGHMKLDAVVQKCLDESENEKLKKPITPDDYLELFKLIISKTRYHTTRKKPAEYHVSVVKAMFLEPGTESPEWKDFTRMVDMCLERGRFRAVRVLWHFYTDESEKFFAKEGLEWQYATKYLVNGEID